MNSHKGYQTDYNADHSLISAPGRPDISRTNDLGGGGGPVGDGMTNLERYKQKLKTQRVIDQPGSHTPQGPPNHRPSLQYKASVRDTVSKLQEQSRLNGSAYGTNQFSSMDVRTRDQDNNAKPETNDRPFGGEESDNDRLEVNTTSEEIQAAQNGNRKGIKGPQKSARGR